MYLPNPWKKEASVKWSNKNHVEYKIVRLCQYRISRSVRLMNIHCYVRSITYGVMKQLRLYNKLRCVSLSVIPAITSFIVGIFPSQEVRGKNVLWPWPAVAGPQATVDGVMFGPGHVICRSCVIFVSLTTTTPYQTNEVHSADQHLAIGSYNTKCFQRKIKKLWWYVSVSVLCVYICCISSFSLFGATKKDKCYIVPLCRYSLFLSLWCSELLKIDPWDFWDITLLI
jgi:hypothetical protein